MSEQAATTAPARRISHALARKIAGVAVRVGPRAGLAAASVGLALAWSSAARAQGGGAAPREPFEAARQTRLGRSPGSGASPLGGSPGAGEATFEGQMGAPGPRFVPEPFPEATRPSAEPTTEPDLGLPVRSVVTPSSPYSSLSLAGPEDEGPAHGLTLDMAIERLLRCNLELWSKSFELPKADADVLTAGLRANPVLYTDVQLVPYGNYSTIRPGGQTQYDLNFTYPLDVTGKRKARVLVACRARRVLQAQFQDTVRLEIDNLYTQWVNVLASRETVREARDSVAEYENQPAAPSPNPGADAEHMRLLIQREAAEIGLREAVEELQADRRALGALLRIPPAEAERLELRGSLRDPGPPPAPLDDLVRLALAARSDLVAYRLGLGRAEADVQLALANRYPDLFVLYQPYTFQNNAPQHLKSAHSWGAGMAVPLPVFNRNQGNIQRARLNVAQTQAELNDLEDQVVLEVRQAERLYAMTRASARQIERSLLPRARRQHDRVYRLYLAGKADELDFLTAERDYDQVVRQYRDTLVRHRRAMLKLNTAVGQRILP